MFKQTDYPKLFNQYEKLLYRVLWDLHIYPHTDYFDDFFQKAQLHLYQCAQTFAKNPLEQEQHYAFTAYARKMIRWRLVDDLRQLNRQHQFEQQDTTPLGMMAASQRMNSGRCAQAFMLEAKKRLTASEYIFLCDLLNHQGDVRYFTNKYGVSKQAIHQRKKRLAKKLLPIKALLEWEEVGC